MISQKTHPARRAQAQQQVQWARALRAREWNPVVVREGRARWRGARAFWLALAYASFLGLVLWWSYSHPSGPRVVDAESPNEAFGAAAQLGHEMFGVLSYCQLAAWLLLAPILTCSSLSGERQKGLLEGLLLSRLSTFQIVRGKWASALGLIVLLQLAGLPVLAVCFLLGGVSPGELIGAFAIQLATACCGAACGLASSSYSRNNSDAASGAIALVILWMLFTGAASTSLGANANGGAINEHALLIAAANPVVAMMTLLSPVPPGVGFSAQGNWSVFFASGCGWMVSVAGMALLTLWHLWRASRVLLRSPEKFDEPPSARPAAASTCASTCAPPASSIAASEGWQSEQRHAEVAPPMHGRPPGRWQMPVLERIVFGDAMMRRELSLLWRWPRLSGSEHAGMCLLMLMLCGLALMTLLSLFVSPGSARDVWWGVLSLYGVAGALLCAARPASSIAHEREGGLWQGLNLTLLSPLQVAGAKAWAPIVACLGYGSPAWVFLILAAWQGQIGIGSVLCGLLVMLLAWAQVASWSVLVGTRARLPASALGWGLGGPILAWVGLPLLMSLFNGPSQGGALRIVQLLHPAVAMNRGSTLGEMLGALVLHATLALILFAMAWRAVQHSHRESNRKSARGA